MPYKDREKRNEYDRKYRQKNLERIRDRDRKYYQKKKVKDSEQRKILYQKNPEKFRKRSLASYYKDREKIIEKRKKFRLEHKERLNKRRRDLYHLVKDNKFSTLLKIEGFCQFDGCEIADRHMLAVHHLFPKDDETIVVLCLNHHGLIDHRKEGFYINSKKENNREDQCL